MAKTLGLDIGTNSVGWCLMEDKNRILRCGVRIFPVGVEVSTAGKEQSKNVQRRTARGARRLYDRYKLRRKELRRILLELEMLPDIDRKPMTAKELYHLRVRALDEKIALKEIGRILLLLNQRRGFRSNRKAKNNEDTKKLTETPQEMEDHEKLVSEGGFRTIGEYFYSLYKANEERENWHNPDEPIEPIRRRFIKRSMYEVEFDSIWRKQSEFYPAILTEANYHRIKDRCIFYQRKLKSQKHSVAFCRFEEKKRVAPKSSLLFQEFRIWQTVSLLRFTGGTRFREFLTIVEREKLAKALMEVRELSHAEAKKLLGFPRGGEFNDLPNPLLGNKTLAAIKHGLGSEFLKALPAEGLEKIWNILYFAQEDWWLRKYGQGKLGLSEEGAKRFSKISFEADYCSLSHKAMSKILPWLKKGLDYSAACKAVAEAENKPHYHHSFDEETEGKDRELEPFINREKRDAINELRNPIVMQALSETVRLVNAIIQEEGRPDRIRIEMARELKKPKKIREEMRFGNTKREKLRESYREFIKEKNGWKTVSNSILQKFELWLEMDYAEDELKKYCRRNRLSRI